MSPLVNQSKVTRKARKARRCSAAHGGGGGIVAGGGGARSPSDGGLVRVEPVEPPGQLGASAFLQRVGALLDLVDLLALDLGPPPEHLHTLPLEQAEPRGEECCGYCCSSCSCCCQAQGLRLFL